MLFLVSTPIGNLSDFTYRAVEVLKACDYVLCEDTRHSKRLMEHYGIATPLHSYHKFNERRSLGPLLDDLRGGKKIALVSDAGTPGIADPGQLLVAACVSEGIEVVPVPGACAAITALSASGLETERFQFIGFLPKKHGELQTVLAETLYYPGTTICYESPHRIKDLLTLINELAPRRTLVVMREITKKFEEHLHGTASDILSQIGAREAKGEFVVMFAEQRGEEGSWNEVSIEEQVRKLQETFGVSLSEAIKIVARERGVPKNQIYKQFHSSSS